MRCAAMCRDVLCLCLCRERREGRHIPYFAVVYRTPREITAVDLLGNKIVTDITLYPYLDTFYPGKYLAVNRCLPACWRVDHRFLIEHLSYLIKHMLRSALSQFNHLVLPFHRVADPMSNMRDVMPGDRIPPWPLRLAVASRRRCSAPLALQRRRTWCRRAGDARSSSGTYWGSAPRHGCTRTLVPR